MDKLATVEEVDAFNKLAIGVVPVKLAKQFIDTGIVCQWCGEKTGSLRRQLNHARACVKRDPSTYVQCPNCHERRANKRNLRKHLPKCRQLRPRLDRPEKTIEAVSDGRQCPYCAEIFKAGALHWHKKRCAENPTKKPKPEAVKVRKIKNQNLKCHLCSRRFVNTRGLQMHSAWHARSGNMESAPADSEVEVKRRIEQHAPDGMTALKIENARLKAVVDFLLRTVTQ